MSERTGLDALIVSMLECVAEVSALRDGQHVKSTRVVDHAYETRGIPPRYGYDAVCSISAPWLVHLRLIDFHGNGGSPDSNDEPANARYTEVRLSPAGVMALAAERGELPRLPIGLSNGDLILGGNAPPFDPARIATALLSVADGGADAALVEAVGLPAFPTRCSVDGDLAALASGSQTRLRLSAAVAFERYERGSRLVLSNLPFGIGSDDVSVAIANRVDAARDRGLRSAYPDLQEQMDLGLRDVRNETIGDSTRIVCDLLPDADPQRCRERLLATWPVTTEFDAQLRAPVATMVRQIADSSPAQHEAMTTLLAP